MNKTEEYLDSLLNNVSPKKVAEEERKRQRRALNFGEDFEKELDETDITDFIQDFEDDIDTESPASSSGRKESQDNFFGSIEGIVNNAKETVSDTKTSDKTPEKENGFEVNTLEDDSWTEPPASQPEMAMPSAEEEIIPPSEGIPSDEAKEILDLLEGLPSDEELSDLGNMFAGDNGSLELEDEQQEPQEPEPSEKSPKKEKKNGFLQKLMSIFSGLKKEKQPKQEESEGAVLAEGSGAEDFGDISDENLQILQELNDAEQAGKSSKKEKGKKKKEKKKEKKTKEQKEQEKKAKQEKKEKKAKEKKEKKEKAPKKPKEVDLSPPLKKAPVILIAIMGVSVLLFILLSSSFLGYSVPITEAKEAYAVADYVTAYEKIAGLKPKEKDEEFHQQIMLLARVQSEFLEGESLYGLGKYTMSLDSYICALGRYDVNYEEAALYHVESEYDDLAGLIQTQMAEKFGVSAETAREIYALDDRTEYTRRIYDIVKGLGLIE